MYFMIRFTGPENDLEIFANAPVSKVTTHKISQHMLLSFDPYSADRVAPFFNVNSPAKQFLIYSPV